MFKKLLAAGIATAALIAPISAFADQKTGSNCNYTSDEDQRVELAPGFVVYASADQVSGSSAHGGLTGTADTDAGTCQEMAGVPGGTVEAGYGAGRGSDQSGLNDGVYAIADGSDANNPGINSSLDGYVGVSNYQAKSGRVCPTDTEPNHDSACSTNSGGAVGSGDQSAPVPFLACGDTTGSDWNNTKRNGCFYP